jgi:hypothetical protein
MAKETMRTGLNIEHPFEETVEELMSAAFGKGDN